MDSPDRQRRLLTRRKLLASAALALGAAGAADLGLPAPKRHTAATAPQRCVSLGANGVINPGSSQDYRSCRGFLRATNTRWVRIWADWPSLQPEGERRPDRGSGAWRLHELDAQLAQAKADGVHVILTSYRFPAWATGAAQADPHPLFKLPADVGPGSAWARWIEFLIRRYGSETIAALELVNEPNSQVWPLDSPHTTVARMFTTAQAIASADKPMLIGPATSDSSEGIPFDAFTGALLDELDALGFEPGAGFAWSHHNYTDVERGEDARAKVVLELLQRRWRGRPGLLIPEGGARLAKIARLYGLSDPAGVRAKQAELISRNWQRMKRLPGVAMLGQYLFYSDPAFDCGLCDSDGTKRPAYAAWAALI